MWKDRLNLTPLRACEMLGQCLAAIGIALIILVSIGTLAHSQTAIETGQGIVCDTPEQVARYLQSKAGDGTLEKINAESHDACAILSVAFFMGEKGEQVTNVSGTWVITKILIIGIVTKEGIGEIRQPVVQYSAFHIEEKGA
jgi:hypothetical protein